MFRLNNMDLFSHIESVVNETNMDYIGSDLPLAIFMIKLLSLKVKFNTISEDRFYKYINSDKPLKLRYYLQVSFKEEIRQTCEKKIVLMNNELDKIKKILGPKEPSSREPIPKLSYEDRLYIYDTYLENFDHEEYREKQSHFHSPVDSEKILDIWKFNYEDTPVSQYHMDRQCFIFIHRQVMSSFGKKYGYNSCSNKYSILKDSIYNVLNKFRDEQSVIALLNSIKNIIELGNINFI